MKKKGQGKDLPYLKAIRDPDKIERIIKKGKIRGRKGVEGKESGKKN